MSRRKLVNLIQNAVETQPIFATFQQDVQIAISRHDYEQRNSRKPSKWYKPSSMVCMRQMYFMRTEADTDDDYPDYQGVGMARTGTGRHEDVQEVLLNMENMGFDWRYIDVAKYIADKQAEGKCQNLKVVGQSGAETKLFHETLKLSFMCDGIMQHIPTGEYYLFEFKNQVSMKARDKKQVDDEHIAQVSAYCLTLDLEQALVLYEGRDFCDLYCPELLTVTQEMKQAVVDRILACEEHVESHTPPPMHEDTKPCRWCKYRTKCRKVGRT